MRTLTLLVSLAALVFFAGSAMAGDYHTATALVCSDCHNMHYSQTHDYTGGSTGALGAGGPFATLLKSSANSLCLSCHDGSASAPDVVGANTGAYVRQAGALTTGSAPHEDYKGHTLNSTAVATGGTWSDATGLKCVDCHTIHGETTGITYPAGYTDGQYRNLVGRPGNAAAAVPLTYAKGTNNTTLQIFERDATLGQIATHYSVNNVDFNEPSATASAYAQWCKGCHTNFHGASTDPIMQGTDGWVRHPTAGVNLAGSMLTQYKSHTNKVKMLVGAGVDNYTPSCMSCHKSHGNKNAYGLIYLQGTGTVTEEGDSGTNVQNLCRQCHTQGAG